jgi:lysozyme family protein
MHIAAERESVYLCLSFGMANANRTFEIALQFVLEHEGELANHPYDRGDNFWIPLKCDSLPPPIAIFLFDSAVGSGHSIPTRWLQRAIGATPDGIVGNETIQKAQKAFPQAVVDSMLRQRMLLYANIVRHDRRQNVFLYGWLRRTMNLVDLVYRHYLREI